MEAYKKGRFLEFDKSEGAEFRQERGERGNPDAKFIPLAELGKQAAINYKHGADTPLYKLSEYSFSFSQPYAYPL